MTAIVSGISLRERPPVELTTYSSSKARPVDAGSSLGAEPVAIMKFLALISSTPPSLRSTAI